MLFGMFRSVSSCLCLLLLSRTAYADEVQNGPAKPAETLSAPETFESLRMIGDLERMAGRDVDAAISYARALSLRHDPLVAGRLGVLLVKFGRYEDAAEKLLDAIQLATDAPPAERKAFTDAFEKALSHGAWLHVSLSHAGAQVFVDGVPKNGPGRSAFYTFVSAGEHIVHAHLDGYHDVTVPFTAQKRKEARVSITFVPLPLPELPASPAAAIVEPAKSAPLSLPGLAKPVSTSGLPKQEDPWGYPDPAPEKPKDDSKGFHGSISVGPVVLFGVASWMPAVGGMVGGAWRPNQYVTVGLEGRAAWLTVGVGGAPISAMTAGGLLTGCGHVKWFYGCALGHLGVTNIEFARGSFTGKTYSFFQPGIGARVGVRVPVSRSLALRASIDAFRLRTGIKVVVEEIVIADLPPALIGAQVGGDLEW